MRCGVLGGFLLLVVAIAPCRADGDEWGERLGREVAALEAACAKLDQQPAAPGNLAVRVRALNERVTKLEEARGIGPGTVTGSDKYVDLTKDVVALGSRLAKLRPATAARPTPKPAKKGPFRGVERPPDLTPAEAQKRLSMLTRKAARFRETAKRLWDVCGKCYGARTVGIYKQEPRTDSQGRTYYVTVRVGTRTCPECNGLPYSVLEEPYGFVYHDIWSPIRQSRVPVPAHEHKVARPEDLAFPPLPMAPALIANLKWPRFFDGTHGVFWVKPRLRDYEPVRWIWVGNDWYLYDAAYDGPWPDPPGSAPAEATPPEPEAADAPDADLGEELGLRDEYDRFVGTRRITAVSEPILAKHQADAADAIQIRAVWEVLQEPPSPAVVALRFESRGAIRRWVQGTQVFFLIDGARRRSEATSAVSGEAADVREVLDVAAVEEIADSLVAAKRVEVRAGDWEFELPAPFLDLVRSAMRKKDAGPPVIPAAAPPAEGPAAPPEISERFDRFAGSRHLRVAAVPVAALGRDAARATLSLSWETFGEEGMPTRHLLRLESEDAVRRWPTDPVVHFLVDGNRLRLQGTATVGEKGDRETLDVAAPHELARAIAGASRAELRAGDWDVEIPARVRAGIAEALRRIDPAVSPDAPETPPAPSPSEGAAPSPPPSPPPNPAPVPEAEDATDAALRRTAGGLFAHRRDRSQLQAQGGSSDTERAVEAALAWLAAHQSPTGEWACAGYDSWLGGKAVSAVDPGGRGQPMYDVGVTGLALCAFLGAGHSAQVLGPYTRTVERGLDALIEVQDPGGCFGARTTQHYVYNHAMAALAMVEAYAQTGFPRYRRSAQLALDFIELARNPFFGWRYGVKPGDNDTSITASMLTVIGEARVANDRAKRRGLSPPFRIAEDGIEGGLSWLTKMTDRDYGRVGYITTGSGGARPQERVEEFPTDKTESTTAASCAVRLLLGESPSKSDMLKKGLDLVARLPPLWSTDGDIDMYYWYYGTQAMRWVGGSAWSAWNAALKDALLPSQRTDGSAAFKGSWDPIDVWGRDGGRVYSTAMCALCLESYYRSPKD